MCLEFSDVSNPVLKKYSLISLFQYGLTLIQFSSSLDPVLNQFFHFKAGNGLGLLERISPPPSRHLISDDIFPHTAFGKIKNNT